SSIMNPEGSNKMNIGAKIIEIRKQRNMTQEDFAKIFHVTRQTVSNWENEKSYPDLQTLVQISNEFDVSLDTMLKEDMLMVKRIDRKSTRLNSSHVSISYAV